MITRLLDVPDNMVGFDVTGTVTKEDYEAIVMPAVQRLVERTGELNYLMVINTDIGKFTAGAWLQDVLLGIKQLTKWNRAAILTDSDAINTFTDIFSVIVPGEFKGYRKTELQEAIDWVSGGK